MPTINLAKDKLKELTGIMDDEKLKDEMAMFGTDLEKMTEDEVEVEIFPNRPDMLSLEGFAKSLRGYLGREKGLYSFNIKNDVKYKAKKDQKVEEVRPELACAVVKDLDLRGKIDSLMQLQEKLHVTHGRNRKKVAIGIHDLESITGPFTYTTKSPDTEFIPLQTSKKMSMEEILKEHEKGVEFRSLVENFDEYPVWIDGNGDIFSMPPVINSKKTVVTDKTQDIFIDVTGTDKEAVEKALNIILLILNEMDGKIYPVDLNGKIYPDLEPKKMKFNPDHVKRTLGINLEKEQVVDYLERMGYGAKIKENYINVEIPSYRTDILHEVDLVEDIAIAHGYNNFNRKIPDISTVGGENSLIKFKRKLRELMIGMEFLEIKNYYLSNKDKLFRKMNLEEQEVAEAENALSEEHSCLRNWLMPSIMETFGKNQHRKYPQKIFEIGKTININHNKPTGTDEINKLAGAISEDKTGFTEIKKVLKSIFKNIDLDFKVKEEDHASFINGRCGSIIVNNEKIGLIGEIKPEVLIEWGIQVPVAAFELNVEKLFEAE